MVRRRRNQADARHREAQLGDVFGHFSARQLTAFARLRALRHLDLDLIGIGQVLGRHAKAAGSHLLDLGTHGVAGLERDVALDPALADQVGQGGVLFHRLEAHRILAAFAGVGLAADAVHGYRQHGMRLGRNRSERHGAGSEARHNRLGRFHFIQRHRSARRLDLEQAAQGQMAAALVVDQLGVFLVGVIPAGTRRVLQLGDGVRRPHVLFATHPEGILAACVQRVGQHRVIAERGEMHAQRLFGHLRKADAFDIAGSAGEILFNERSVETDRIENLRAAIGLVGRNAHLGHDLVQALADRLDEFLLSALGILQPEAGNGFERQPRTHGFGAIAGEQGEVMHFPRGAGIDHQACAGTQAGLDQMMMHGSGRQQRGDRDLVATQAAVGQDQHVVAVMHRLLGRQAQRVDGALHALDALRSRVGDVDHQGTEALPGQRIDLLQLRQFIQRQHRLAGLQSRRRTGFVNAQQIGLGPDEGHQRHHQLFANRVDRGIGHLRKQLLEIVIQRPGFVGQHRQGAVGTHGTGGFLAVRCHRLQDELEVFLRVTEGLLHVQHIGFQFQLAGDLGQIIQAIARFLDPLVVGPGLRQLLLHFGIIDDAAGFQVDQEHLARLQTPLLDDLFFGEGQHAHFGSHHDVVVVGDQVARRTQAVTIQRGTDHTAISEGHGGGAVPRLHQRGMVFVEGAAIIAHQRIAGAVFRTPGFRDQHHHGVRQRIAARHQQFQRIVETGGVGLAFGDQRPQFFQILAQHGGFHRFVAGGHPVDVAAHGVDFAVVGDHAERVRQVPGREGVGGETLVHQGQGRNHGRVLQVEVIGADLFRQQHALVDDGAAGQRGNVELFAVFQLERADFMFHTLADDEQLALEGILIGRVTGNEHLTHDRFVGAGSIGDVAVVARHIAPAETALAFFENDARNGRFASGTPVDRLRQEHHAAGIAACGRQGDVEPGGSLAQEGIGQLDQHAGAVTQLGVISGRPSMGQVAQDLQTPGYDVVAFPAFDVRYETDPARVLLVCRII
ncbi:hypothetical protein GALL_343050 [mine drainage metagenome]|uniref:Uncharacterized protein n=1 Tax=mine drainage metagenome TaxID=410659 RepID=A0A1J5QK47_9ZZZZ